jgi:hypothetical protein
MGADQDDTRLTTPSAYTCGQSCRPMPRRSSDHHAARAHAIIGFKINTVTVVDAC